MTRKIQFHKLKPDESREADGEPVYLTPEGIARLEKELARLKRIMPEAAAEAARTAAYGDRSDNAEYKQAKGTLRRMHHQMFEIENQLKRAAPIARGRNAAGTIQLGSTVVLVAESAGEAVAARKIFEIVGPKETDPAHGRISHQSPLGAALIGHAEGDLVTIATGRGNQSYRVAEIK